MIKRTLVAFLLAFTTMAIHAADTGEPWLNFQSTVIENAINSQISGKYRTFAKDTYHANMDAAGRISIQGMYKVCYAAGMDISQSEGFNQCLAFLNFIMENSEFSVDAERCAEMGGVFNAGLQKVVVPGVSFNNGANASFSNMGIPSFGKGQNTSSTGAIVPSFNDKGYNRAVNGHCVGADGNKLKYEHVCKTDVNNPNCIRVFKDLSTQETHAREFISAYGTQKGVVFTCRKNTRVNQISLSGVQDYISCSAGGAAYEFEFDSINADPGDSTATSEATAMCTMFGGTVLPKSDRTRSLECDIDKKICKAGISALGAKIGRTVDSQVYCWISQDVSKKSTVQLNQIAGIDSCKFFNMGVQARSGDVKPQLEEYLRKQIKDVAPTDISCSARVGVIDGIQVCGQTSFLDKNYFMTCSVGLKEVDFVFADLTETADYQAADGAAKMVCAAKGKYKGRNMSCDFISQDECENGIGRAKEIPGGTHWDATRQICVLNAVENAEKINEYIEIGKNIVVLVAITVLTEGILTKEYAIGLGVFSAGFDDLMNKIQKWERDYPDNKAIKFLRASNDCNNAKCAAEILEKYIGTLDMICANDSEIASECDDLSTGMVDAIGDSVVKMIDLAGEDQAVDAMERSTVSWDAYVGAGATAVAFIGMFFASPQKMGTSLVADLEKIFNRSAKATGTFSQLLKVAQLKKAYNAERIIESGNVFYRIRVSDNKKLPAILDNLQKNEMFVFPEQDVILFSRKNIWGKNLRVAASSHLDEYIKGAQSNSWFDLPVQRLTDAEWAELNKQLAPQGVHLVRMTNGTMRLCKLGDLPFGFLRGKKLSLVELPFQNGGSGYVGNISQRAVVVVSIDGKKIPFYSSSGLAGKKDVPVGEWYPLAGIGRQWFNKISDKNMTDYGNVPELGIIVSALRKDFDSAVFRELALNNSLPYLDNSAYSIINESFPGGVVDYLMPFKDPMTGETKYVLRNEDKKLFENNKQIIKNLFNGF